MRKTIARRLTESKQTVPHFYLTIDVDAAELVKLRERINDELFGAGRRRRCGLADPQGVLQRPAHQGVRRRADARARVQRELYARGHPRAQARRHLGRGRDPGRPRHAGRPQRGPQERRRHRPRGARTGGRARAQEAQARGDDGRNVLDLEPGHVRDRRVRRGHQSSRGGHPRRRPGARRPRRLGRRGRSRASAWR